MEHSRKEDALRIAELCKAFAYLALVFFFLSAVINFVNTMRFEEGFGGFLTACWHFVKDIFWMGVAYLAALGVSHVILLLLDIAESRKPPLQGS